MFSTFFTCGQIVDKWLILYVKRTEKMTGKNSKRQTRKTKRLGTAEKELKRYIPTLEEFNDIPVDGFDSDQSNLKQ